MNVAFYEPLGGCCAGFGAVSPDVCAQNLKDARQNRPNWSPEDYFGATCLDPTLSNDMKLACACAGKIGFTEELMKLAAEIAARLAPPANTGGGNTTGGKGTKADTGGGGGAALTGAALLAWLLMGK